MLRATGGEPWLIGDRERCAFRQNMHTMRMATSCIASTGRRCASTWSTSSTNSSIYPRNTWWTVCSRTSQSCRQVVWLLKQYLLWCRIVYHLTPCVYWLSSLITLYTPTWLLILADHCLLTVSWHHLEWCGRLPLLFPGWADTGMPCLVQSEKQQTMLLFSEWFKSHGLFVLPL